MPDDSKNPDSLGDDRTFVGEGETPAKSEQSLGDAGTHADGGDSSLSGLANPGNALELDLPLIDLSARFEIEGELGKGGMGAVHLATDRQLKRKVAIKRILGPMVKSQSAIDRFITEAQSIAALSHFNIVQIHEFGRDEEGPLLIMEYVSGGSLLDRLKEGKLEAEDAVGITCQLCDGLAAAHEQGIIHRDVKPANILLTETGVPKLTDFGLARQNTTNASQTQVGAVLGTIDFMPPEQRQDATAVDTRSDLWSLAATCYQMLTGDVPRVIDLEEVPKNIRPVLSKALKIQPSNRYQDVAAFRQALEASSAESTPPTNLTIDDGITTDGQCPECGKINDLTRDFCQSCGGSLKEPCLKCEQSICVWEQFCGKCGGNVAQLIAEQPEKMKQQKEQILTWRDEHEDYKAIEMLETIASSQDKRFSAHIAWATERLETYRESLLKLENDRDQLIVRAKEALKTHKPKKAIELLEAVPVPIRKDEVAQLLREASVKVKNFDNLLPRLKRSIQLHPRAASLLAVLFLTVVAGIYGVCWKWRDTAYQNYLVQQAQDSKAWVKEFGGHFQTRRYSDDSISDSVDFRYAQELTDADLEHLKGLTNLTVIDLSDCQLYGDGLKHLKDLSSLEELDLGRTQVDGASLVHLKGLTNLKDLALNGTQVDDSGLEHLKGLKNLESLSLTRTQITDAGLVHLREMTSLTTLSLGGEGTNLTDEGLIHLKRLRNLELLFVHRTFTEPAVRELERVLPNCEIHSSY